jgi:predicted lipid-binding transport protein (Tim44 family)
MDGGGFPIDLILFGMIAAFLVLRLRSILGRRTGFERQPTPISAAQTGPMIDAQAEPVAPISNRSLPDPAGLVGQALVRMRGIDRNFDSGNFLNGAEGAFRMIVAAFAAGDRQSLKGLLSDDTYRSFESVIAAREAAGHKQISELRAIHAATIEGAELAGNTARISVRFVSDQISLTEDAGGAPVAGTDAVTELVDIWSFERDLTSSDPAWRLVAAASA